MVRICHSSFAFDTGFSGSMRFVFPSTPRVAKTVRLGSIRAFVFYQFAPFLSLFVPFPLPIHIRICTFVIIIIIFFFFFNLFNIFFNFIH
ncbi:hypothetical protein Hanom_Chr13g01240141 [Helianthus anomalus]